MVMKQNQSQVSVDPQVLDKNALGGIGIRDVRIAITAVVAGDLIRHGATTQRGRHVCDELSLGQEIWPRVRYLPCLGNKSVEEVFRLWPASGSAVMSLGGLVRVLLNAASRRAELQRELTALDALDGIAEHHAPDPAIALSAKLKEQFPAATYDPTGAAR